MADFKHSNDATLIRACLAGEQSAWNTLVERYSRLVYSVPRKLGLSDNDADDIFQVVFGIVLRKLETLRDHDRLAAWLIRTTHREAYRLLRSRDRRSGWRAGAATACTARAFDD
jgi:RNA polymerase sigma factor (sigma-70 family)